MRFKLHEKIQKVRGQLLTKNRGGGAGERWLVRLLVDGDLWKDVTLDNLRYGNSSPFLRNYWRFMRQEAEAWEMAHPNSNQDTDEMTLDELREGRENRDQDLVLPPVLSEARQAILEKEGDCFYETAAAESNFRMLCERFSLTDCEAQILYWIIWFSRSTDVRTVFNMLDFAEGGLDLYSNVISYATGMAFEDIRRALSSDGALMKSGLIAYSGRDNKEDIEDWFLFFDEELGGRLMTQVISAEELLFSHLNRANNATLALTDFERLPEVATLLLPYLEKALSSGRPGVNILLYGPPGTGKTELTRTVAQALNVPLWEVATHREERQEKNREYDRLRHWRVADQMLGKAEGACLVIDEAEDVFHNHLRFTNGNMVRSDKGELNQSLETNIHPTFWVLNNIGFIDPAMMRRFDVVLEVPMPSVRERRRMIDKASDGTLSEALCDRLSRTEALSPAVLSRALAVANTMSEAKSSDRDEKVEALINAQLSAIGVGQIVKALESTSLYSLAAVNADIDLEELAKGLSRTKSGRLCLYGVPGTGKSAWAKHLAKTLEMPIIVKRASDLLSCWVGMTEKNIASAFKEAEREKAILLIDEADSFLQDRGHSQHSWETTQVNEMLTQIEAFEGIFIATTNLIETLDAASLRRFDVKVRFDVMSFDQAKALLAAHLDALGLTQADDHVLEKLGQIDQLTPGDFASVLRRSRCVPVKDANDFVTRLTSDCELKRGKDAHRRSIGF